MIDNNQIMIGNRIKSARKAKGLNQQQLGDLIGKSIRSVQMYEKGESDISISMLYEIAKKLEVPATYLFGYEVDETPLENLSDVLGFLFKLQEIENVHYHIDIKKPPLSDAWECAIVFHGKDNAEYNADLCLVLESFKDELEEYETYVSTKESFEQWKNKTLAYYANCKLEQKEDEILSAEERIRRRNNYLNTKYENKKNG